MIIIHLRPIEDPFRLGVERLPSSHISSHELDQFIPLQSAEFRTFPTAIRTQAGGYLYSRTTNVDRLAHPVQIGHVILPNGQSSTGRYNQISSFLNNLFENPTLRLAEIILPFVTEYIVDFSPFKLLDARIRIEETTTETPCQFTAETRLAASHVSNQKNYHLARLKQIELFRINNHFIQISARTFDLELGILALDRHRVGELELLRGTLRRLRSSIRRLL